LQCAENNEVRLSSGKAQRQAVENMHVGNGWQKYIDNIMDNVPSRHKVNLINENDDPTDSNDIALADLQSKAVLCDKSALLSLIAALRSHSQQIKHSKLVAALVHALILFGISNSKVFWFELTKTMGSIVLPGRLYQMQRRAHLAKRWGKRVST
jgi:hypothetical protein